MIPNNLFYFLFRALFLLSKGMVSADEEYHSYINTRPASAGHKPNLLPMG